MTSNEVSVQNLFDSIDQGIFNPAKYKLRFTLPKGILNPNSVVPDEVIKHTKGMLTERNMRSFEVLCNSANLPGRTLDGFETKSANSVKQFIALGSGSPETFTVSVILDAKMKNLVLVETWQALAVNTRSSTINFIDEYAGDCIIEPINNNLKIKPPSMKLETIWPISLSDVMLGYSNGNQFSFISVGFAFLRHYLVNQEGEH